MKKIDNFTERFNNLIGVADSYQAPDRLMEILYNREEREAIFKEMLGWFEYDVDFDWFHQYFQEEHADRKGKKQDFTPNSVGTLMAELMAIEKDGGNYYEVAAGTGGLMIRHWDTTRRKVSPFSYDCWDYFHTVEELSDRTIPFLLFNMMLRGMNGIVIHGDSISRNAKGVFFIQNFTGDHLQFSDLNVLPYTDDVAEEFNIQWEWVKKEGKKTEVISTEGYYPEHIERSWYDEENLDYINNKLMEKQLWKEYREETQNNPELTPRAKELLEIIGL